MQVETRHFGMLEVDDDEIISFDNGLPGFEYIRKFFIVNTEDSKSPFKWLQSFDFPELAFVVADPFSIIKDYYVDIPDSFAEELEIRDPSDAAVFAVVVVPEDISKITANLKCPVIINTRTRKGSQVIIENSPYQIKHPLAVQS